MSPSTMVPKCMVLLSLFDNTFFFNDLFLNILSTILIESLPEIRISAIAPLPGGVDKAIIVESLLKPAILIE